MNGDGKRVRVMEKGMEKEEMRVGMGWRKRGNWGCGRRTDGV